MRGPIISTSLMSIITPERIQETGGMGANHDTAASWKDPPPPIKVIHCGLDAGMVDTKRLKSISDVCVERNSNRKPEGRI